MRIKTLAINRFGQFDNQRIHLPDVPFVIIYGENESGKSTMMHFILNTLFGYPSKSELAKWMPAGETSRFGGSLTFFGDDGRRFTLERMYREKDRPRLFIGNGGTGDIDALFRGMDRLLYQSVFCFDLEGLRGIDKMKPADLNDFLLGAGMLGSGRLTRIEQELRKKSGGLFKKGGRRPDINRLLNDLEKEQAALKKWERKLDDYRLLQERIHKEQAKIEALDRERRTVEQTAREMASFLTLKPVMTSYRALEKELENAGPLTSFPENGREKYDAWTTRIVETESEKAVLLEKINQLDASIQEITIDKTWLEEEENIAALSRSAALDARNLQEIQRTGEDLRRHKAEYHRLLEQLGERWTTEKVLGASIDYAFKNEWKEKTERWREVTAKRKDAARALSDQEETVRQISRRMDILKRQGEAIAAGAENQRVRPHAAKFPPPVRVMAAALLSSVGLGAAAWTYITPGAGIFVFLSGVFFSVLFSLSFIRFFRSGSMDLPINEMKKSDRTRREAELHVLSGQLAQAEGTLQQRKADIGRLKNEMASRERSVMACLAAHGYETERPEWAAETVALIEEARRLLSKIDMLEEIYASKKDEHERFEREKERLAGRLNLQGASISSLEKQLALAKEKERQASEWKKQRDVYTKQQTALQAKLDRFRAACARLIEQAGVKTEQQFFTAARRFEHLSEIRKKRDERYLQLLEITGGEAALKRYLHELDEGKWENTTETELKERIAAISEEKKAAGERMIRYQAECRSVEGSRSYRDALDRDQSLRTALLRKAREWAVYRTADWAIEKVKNRYRKEKLPKVLSTAQRYFCQMTGGAYMALFLEEADGFIAERSDGRHFMAAELSRGTAEQLYLSLRLALTEIFDTPETLPLIIDDGLVNFDSCRAEQVYSLLSKVSESRQVVLFTCHRSAFMHQHPESILSLSDVNRRVFS
ncbi:hypothetical protein EWH99_11575 [Sporolactobacillus sp. THM7-7]|nr:hypothetical protein EWH99_11575 [Sporolactobacillus sp. THM7-7]